MHKPAETMENDSSLVSDYINKSGILYRDLEFSLIKIHSLRSDSESCINDEAMCGGSWLVMANELS